MKRFVKIDEHVLSILDHVYKIREQERTEERDNREFGEFLDTYSIFERMGGTKQSPTYRALCNARSGKTKWLSVGNFDRILCAIERPELIHYFKEYTVMPNSIKEHTDLETWDIPEGGII